MLPPELRAAALEEPELAALQRRPCLALRYFGTEGRKAIAIDPSYISKAGKKTPHIGRFWSGCAGAVKHGLEIMGLGLIDIDAHNCMMLRTHQTPGNFELKKRNKTLATTIREGQQARREGPG